MAVQRHSSILLWRKRYINITKSKSNLNHWRTEAQRHRVEIVNQLEIGQTWKEWIEDLEESMEYEENADYTKKPLALNAHCGKHIKRLI